MQQTIEENSQQFEYGKFLTELYSFFTAADVARFDDIVCGLEKLTQRQKEELMNAADERNKLREAYLKFHELATQWPDKEETLKVGLALLLNAPRRKANDTVDGSVTYYKEIELPEYTGVVLATDDLKLSNFPLWKVIREVIRQTAEIRVFELQKYLKMFGLKASRPGVESAITTHSKEFAITKRGREKYVSLKGA